MNDILLESLTIYYENSNNLKKLNDILNNNIISLRIIDWFVTNYSKKNNIFYEIYKTKNGKLTFNSDGNKFYKQMNVYQSYKSKLKSFNKKKFDPFCRKNRILFLNYETTIGQLNFFQWAIDSLIIEYIQKNNKDIENDMFNNSTNIKKNSKERKKRQELSKSVSRGLNLNKRNIILNFN